MWAYKHKRRRWAWKLAQVLLIVLVALVLSGRRGGGCRFKGVKVRTPDASTPRVEQKSVETPGFNRQRLRKSREEEDRNSPGTTYTEYQLLKE